MVRVSGALSGGKFPVGQQVWSFLREEERQVEALHLQSSPGGSQCVEAHCSGAALTPAEDTGSSAESSWGP